METPAFDLQKALEPFSKNAENTFIAYLQRHKRRARMTAEDIQNAIFWLTNLDQHGQTTAEHNNRKSALERFRYDKETGNLIALKCDRVHTERVVIPEHQIFKTICYEHHQNGHSGQLATGKAIVNNYYSIAQEEVYFLLPHCNICT